VKVKVGGCAKDTAADNVRHVYKMTVSDVAAACANLCTTTVLDLTDACGKDGTPDGRLFESVTDAVAPLKLLPTGSVICELNPPP
jgi:hypothetical protein